MKSAILLCVAAIVLSGCDSSDALESADLQKMSSEFEGTYTGIFFRNQPFTHIETANVELNFDGNEFAGSSDINKYPAICHGSFDLAEGEIEFQNECFWTAEFDWSIILAGKFEAVLRGDSLFLTKRIDANTWDHYHLVRTVGRTN